MTTNERIRATSATVVESDLPRHMTIDDYRRARRESETDDKRGILNRRKSALRRARRALFAD